MSLFRLVGVLTVVAASLWLEPSAYAICVDDETCAPCRVCVNYQCVQPSCVPSGCIDDVLYNTHCCSGAAVPGSTYCVNQADWGTTWASCYQTCA
jgi:hypothetical protein